MSNQQQGSDQMTGAERKAAEKATAEAAAAEKAEQEKAEQEKAGSTSNSTGPHLHFEADGVQLQRGDEVVTAYKPATITRLISEGWKVVD